MTHTVEIPKKVESANKHVGRATRWAYKSYRDGWYKVLALFFPPLKKDRAVLRRYVQIVSHRKQICDKGNFIQGCKPLLDHLVKTGWIKDDNEEWLEDTYLQRVEYHNERTVITVSDKPIGKATG